MKTFVIYDQFYDIILEANHHEEVTTYRFSGTKNTLFKTVDYYRAYNPDLDYSYWLEMINGKLVNPQHFVILGEL